MSTLKVNRQQLGQSGTATQNFVWDASAADGTCKLARGNAGATTQDILTVNALGEVDLPQLIRSYGASGYQKLPGGLIIQWGTTAVSGSNTTWPVAFPTACLCASVLPNSSATTMTYGTLGAAGCVFSYQSSITGANQVGADGRYIAIGY